MYRGKHKSSLELKDAFLEDVIKGIGMVYQTKRALSIDSIQVTVRCDNSSVVAWLNRKEARHWRAARGTSAAAVEGKLQTLTDNITSAGIHIKVVYIESAKNLSDCLSRIPLYMLPEAQAADLSDAKMLEEEACMLVIPRIRNDVIRNESGLIVMNENDPKLLKLLNILHEHEGAQVLFERLRKLVQVPNLRAICRAFVARCADCQLSKVTRNAEDQIALGEPKNPLPYQADRPWKVIHMDVQGPYCSDSLVRSNFVITLIDRCTGYLIVQPSRCSPNTAQVVSTFRRVLNVFNACPEICHTDNGSIFEAAEFLAFLNSFHCQPVKSPVGAHWCNGKVERVHRILHEHLLARGAESDFVSFQSNVLRIAQNITTATSNRVGVSPHELIFGYPSWTHPNVPLYLRPDRACEEMTSQEPDNPKRPQKGQIWLLRRSAIGERNLTKTSRPFRPVRIIRKISPRIFRVQLSGGAVKRIHLKHLKRVDQRVQETLTPEEMPPPFEEGGMSEAEG